MAKEGVFDFIQGLFLELLSVFGAYYDKFFYITVFIAIIIAIYLENREGFNTEEDYAGLAFSN